MKIYLISGESYLLINEAINDIVKSSKNITTFDLNIDTLDMVMVEAGYVNMFQEEKYIIVKNANFFGTGKISEKMTDLLMNYLNNPNSLSVLIFVTNEKVDMRKKITKIIKDKYTLKVIPNLKFYEIEDRLKAYFNKYDFKIDEEAVKYIVSNNLNNYDLVMNEAKKIMLYYDEAGYISYQDVVNLASKTLNSNNFSFVDAVVDNDLENSLKLFKDLKTLKTDPSILIALLARDFRLMLNIKLLQERGIREYNIMNELGLMDWQLEKYLKKAFPYKIKELETIMKKIANLDLDIKRGKIDRFMGLELFILDICA